MTDVITPEHSHTHDDHGHEHGHDEGHAPAPRAGVLGWALDTLPSLVGLHSHEHAQPFDRVLESNARGVWALKVSLAVMMLTALFKSPSSRGAGAWGCSRTPFIISPMR